MKIIASPDFEFSHTASVPEELHAPFGRELAAAEKRWALKIEREALTQGVRYSRIEADSARITMNQWTKRAERAAERLAEVNKLLGE